MTKRRDTFRPKRTEMVRIDRKEVKRLAKLARSFLPKGKDRIRGRRMSDKRVLVDAFLHVGAAAGTVYKTPWNEVTLKSLAILLADIDDREVLLRSMRGWAAVGKADGKTKRDLRAEVAKDLSAE